MTTDSKFRYLPRIAALALLALVVLLVVAAVAVPLYFVHDYYAAEVARMQRQLTSFTTISGKRPQFVHAIELLKSRDARKFFLKGTSPALASAELQDAVKAGAEGNGGRVLSTQALPVSDESGYRRIGATFQITTSIQNLRRIFYALETKEPFLFIDGLTIRSQVPANYKPSAGIEPDMFIQIDVSAYAPTGTAPAIPRQAKPGNGQGLKS